jgi:F420H(2)-dependent quinone reductase
VKPPKSTSPFWKLFNVMAKANAALYRRTGGRRGGKLGRAPILLLQHVGARSGKRRESPLLYLDDGDKLVIVASKGGTDRHPAWFHNLMANPETEVQVGPERRPVRARRANAEERSAYWPRLVEMYPDYDEYQGHAKDREIPVIVLDPR